MAQRRDNGTSTIYQRPNKSWTGKSYIGRDETGREKFKYFSGKTEAEVKRKIREYNQLATKVDAKKISLQEYLYHWLAVYKKDTIKPSSYDRLESCIRNQIAPRIGMIQLQQLTSDDIQTFLSELKTKDNYSHSVVKKAHDCLHAALLHATIKKDIIENPMLLVRMPDKHLFPTKEIRIFSEKECARIIEETSRRYQTGKPVYQYADAYILMLHTGIRLGEAIGLKKTDWNKEENTLHIQRNIQSVSKRDESGNRLTGKRLITNTTKTYSGDRIIPLNKSATLSIQRLCQQHPNSEYVVCSNNGGLIPPERLERTFYRILRNIGIEQTGTHSLRHTFASVLFSKGIDIKTVSELLGHASIQITLNTYVHLIGKPKYNAVAKLDDSF